MCERSLSENDAHRPIVNPLTKRLIAKLIISLASIKNTFLLTLHGILFVPNEIREQW